MRKAAWFVAALLLSAVLLPAQQPMLSMVSRATATAVTATTAAITAAMTTIARQREKLTKKGMTEAIMTANTMLEAETDAMATITAAITMAAMAPTRPTSAVTNRATATATTETAGMVETAGYSDGRFRSNLY